MSIDLKKASKEEIARGLELLEKENIRKERIKKGEIKGGVKWSEMSEEQKVKARLQSKKRNTLIKLKCQAFDRAVEAGQAQPITEAEVKAEMSA